MKLKLKILYGFAALIFVASFLLFVIRLEIVEPIKISDYNPIIGNADAPVTLVVFGKYDCSVTQKFFEEFYLKLKESYIDTDKIKLVYKHASGSEELQTSAEASLCAKDQGKFLEYSLILFNRTNEWKGNNTIFNNYAKELGLNETVFSNCLRQNVHQAHAEEDYMYGRHLGVKETPTFFINGLMVEGLPSWQYFNSILTKFNYG